MKTSTLSSLQASCEKTRFGDAPLSGTSLTVGIAGLGYGRAYINAFRACGCRVIALCQRDLTSAKAVADQYGIAHAYDDWEEMLQQSRPDVLVIATPPHLHHAMVLAACQRGTHVLCEKPLATNAAQAQEMADAVRAAGRVAMTGFNWRFVSAYQELDALVHEGSLGRIIHVVARWTNGRMAGEHSSPTWRTNRRLAGFGAMGDSGIHLVDMLRATFGEFSRVLAHAGVAHPRDRSSLPGGDDSAEDHCTMIGRLASGADATVVVSRVAYGPTEHTIDVYGTRGAARFRQGRTGARWWDGELTLSEGGPFRPVTPRHEAAPVFGGVDDSPDMTGRTTLALLVTRFVDAIASGSTPSPSIDDGVKAQAVLDAIARSLDAGAWVDVENTIGEQPPAPAPLCQPATR